MLGSLNEFIDKHYQDPSFPPYEPETSEDDITSVIKYSRKKVLEDRSRRRSRVGLSEYIPSDKKYIFTSSSQNAYYKPSKNAKNIQAEQNYITGRKPISESRISSMFHTTNKTNDSQEVGSQNLKREHNLLRAIVRTKLSEHQNIKVSQYEQSFQRMVANLGNVQIKPIVEKSQIIEQEQSKTYRSLQIPASKTKKNTLSHRKRIQFENCLSWSKKHRKNGSFYAEKLGKNVQVENKNASLDKRKQILDSIHKRSASVSFSQLI